MNLKERRKSWTQRTILQRKRTKVSDSDYRVPVCQSSSLAKVMIRFSPLSLFGRIEKIIITLASEDEYESEVDRVNIGIVIALMILCQFV